MLASLIPIALLFVLGCCIGSFINVVVHRLPLVDAPTSSGNGWNLAWPPSRCPQCHTNIRPRHNLPMLSYLMLAGRSPCCQQPIGRHYFVVEGLCGVMTALIGLVLIGNPAQQALTGLLPTLSTLMSLIWGLALHWCLLTLAAMLLQQPQHTVVVWQCLLWLGLLGNLNGAFSPLADAVVSVASVYGLGFLLTTLVNSLLHNGSNGRLEFFNDPLLLATAAALAWFGSGLWWLPILYVAAALGAEVAEYGALRPSTIKPASVRNLTTRRIVGGSQVATIALLTALWWLGRETFPV